MSDLTVHTRPEIDIPLAVVAVGLALLLAITARGAFAAHPVEVAPPSPIVTAAPADTSAPQAAPPAPARAKQKGKGHD